MYILDSQDKVILNSKGINNYCLVEEPGAFLIAATFYANKQPFAIGRYATKDEATEAMDKLLDALKKKDDRLFEMPEATA